MRKLGLALVASLLVNTLLAGWLVAQYQSDVYFRIYIDQFFALNSTYLILTLGVGGGSALGYLFLRRRGQVDSSLSGFQKTKPLKVDGGLQSPALATSQSKVLPAGAPPMQPSKHTAYAVPPISKSSPPSSYSFQRATPGSAWTSAGKQEIANQPGPPASPGPVPRQSLSPPVLTDRTRQPTAPPLTEPRTVPSGIPPQPGGSPAPGAYAQPFTKPSPIPPSPALRTEQRLPPGTQSGARLGEELGFSRWQPERSETPRKDEPGFPAVKPMSEGVAGMEGGLKRVPIEGMGQMQPPVLQPRAQPQVPTSKWEAPNTGTRPTPQAPTAQWVSPVPRQPYTPTGRPGLPGGAVPGQRPQTTPGSAPMRPGQGFPPRPLFPPGQGPPRPLAYPGAARPMQPGPGGPGGFRPGTVVTGPQAAPGRNFAPGQAPGQKPLQPSNQLQSSDVKGSTPLPPARSGQGALPGLGQSSGLGGDLQGSRSAQSGGPSEPKLDAESSGRAEMDWDTALDTILKTLRKDKVGEK